MTFWKHWKYKNLSFVLVGFIVAFILSRLEFFRLFLSNLGNFGYLGAVIAGFLFVSTFTVSTGALILIILSATLNPLEIGLVAGFGAVLGDLTIYYLIKDNLVSELELIYNKIDNKHHIVKLLHSKFFNWSLPVIGAVIIASPLPDELGVSLMGISKMKTLNFILVSFVLNSIGIFLIVTSSVIIKS